MASDLINTATTLSINQIPGQDVRFPTTSSDAIFTFGNFRLEQSIRPEVLISDQTKSSFSNFSTLETLTGDMFNSQEVLDTSINELNVKKNDPASYAYFGSFYTKVAQSINNIVDKFPYALLSQGGIFNYSNDEFAVTSTFQLPLSGLTNQGNLIIFSGSTSDRDELTLFDDYSDFSIQLSSTTTTATTQIHDISSYSYTTGITGLLTFTVQGYLFAPNEPVTVLPVYIRPTEQRYGQYKKTISNLENQLLYGGYFLVPDPESDTFVNELFEWPRNIDGFNPDITGTGFANYTESILSASRSVDEVKTNIMVRTMIPENYLDLDSNTHDYRKLVSVFSTEFDYLKQYIDSIAFAHTVTYSNEESVPDKFITKLSELLGMNLFNGFNEVDFFKYLVGDVDGTGKSYSEFNLELWRRILVNINWLYKKKGTRDALMFIFKLIGAPDCLIEFDEFVYKIQKKYTEIQSSNSKLFTTGNTTTIIGAGNNYDLAAIQTGDNQFGLTGQTFIDGTKINRNGYINYSDSRYVFQEGGIGRGDGQNYINQWEPEFQPTKIVDNIKVYTGSSEYNGTENIINSKETSITLSPASAIECDVKEWYELGTGWWLWGSSHLSFSGLNVPFEWQVENITDVTGNTSSYSIFKMNVAQWLDYIYATNVEPQNRKTAGYPNVGHNFKYMNLMKIYMTYMLWDNNEESNRLTVAKLQPMLDLLERGFAHYTPQLLPATTILDALGTKYRNTLFQRQKFVYPPGINDGSMFKKKLPENLYKQINGVVISANLGKSFKTSINSTFLVVNTGKNFKSSVVSTKIQPDIKETLKIGFNAANSSINFHSRHEKITTYENKEMIGTPIEFPEE